MFTVTDYVFYVPHILRKEICAVRYISGSVKKGRKTYFFVKDTLTGKMEVSCTKYLKHKVMQNRSYNTVLRISRILPFYMDFMSEREMTLKSVSALRFAEQSEHFYEFLMYIKTGAHTGSYREVKNNTANSYLQAVFGLYNFLHRNGELPFLSVLDDRNFSYVTGVGTTVTSSFLTYDGYLKKNEHTSHIATKEDIEKILSACNTNRDKLLIMLMEETGLRIGEALGIRYTEDIDFEKKRIHVRYRDENTNRAYAKNAAERFMKISDATFSLINVYLSENADLFERTDYLFIVLNGKTKGSPLSANTFYSTLETIGKHCGVHVTNHMLRHYFANERRKANWAIVEISKALGHKNISTTENYLHVTPREIEDAQETYLKEAGKNINISDFL